MYKKIKDFKDSKNSWIALFLTTVFLLSSSLFFQHKLNLSPCTLCIYQRLSVLAIFIAALMGLRGSQRNKYVVSSAYVIWISASITGLVTALYQWYETYMVKNNEFYMAECGGGLEGIFPAIATNETLRSFLYADGICSEIDWSLFGLDMYHYMALAFSLYLISALFFSFVNLLEYLRKRKNLFKKMNMRIYFIDGSKVETDFVTFESFKKRVDSEVSNFEQRKPTELDYKNELEEMIYLVENIEDSNFFSVSIDEEKKSFSPDDILKIDLNIIKR